MQNICRTEFNNNKNNNDNIPTTDKAKMFLNASCVEDQVAA